MTVAGYQILDTVSENRLNSVLRATRDSDGASVRITVLPDVEASTLDAVIEESQQLAAAASCPGI